MRQPSRLISGLFALGLLATTPALAETREALIIPPPLAVLDADQAAVVARRAETGSARDQTELGDIYHYGNGLPKDYAKARLWYGKAADQGYLAAMENLANMNYLGEGGAPDDVTAVSWLQKAADYGDGEAQAALGQMYEDGTGVRRDLVQAYKWTLLAAKTNMATYNGNYLARREDEISAKMTPAQIAKARTQAEAWHAEPRSAVQQAEDKRYPH
ncbi:tetratricopeptide repeat protein [Asticcacaulis solisilvae]|uniref:tetratricopeptide repeat protein n=1 Tax=Asticcacaulis solisilvae TaxID=1217274 RepID=UPI003FD75F3C